MPEFEQAQGDRILYEHSNELRPCAGNSRFLDATVVAYETTLGVRAPSPLRYSWLSEADIVSWPPGRGTSVGGQAIGLRAWAREPADVHEVAHLVAGGGNTAPFFHEGLADALAYMTGRRGLLYLEGWSLDPRPNMTATSPQEVDYMLAGLFVNFLLTRHGSAKFMQFYRSLVWPFTMPRICATFAEAFSVDLNEEVEVFMSGSTPSCDELVFSPTPIECAGANIPWIDGHTWGVQADMSCDAPDVVGGDGEDGTRWRWRDVTVDVPLAGTYQLSIVAPAYVWVRFGPCFTCPRSAFATVVSGPDGDQEPEVRLEPGTYYARIIADSGEPHVELTLELLEP